MDTNQHELRKHHGGVSYNMDWEVSRWESGSVSPQSKVTHTAAEDPQGGGESYECGVWPSSARATRHAELV